MMRLLPGENLERFNRISLWIYVDSPAIANNFMELSIHNQGKHIMPLPVGLKARIHWESHTESGSMSFGSSLMSIAILSQVFLCRFMHTALRCLRRRA